MNYVGAVASQVPLSARPANNYGAGQPEDIYDGEHWSEGIYLPSTRFSIVFNPFFFSSFFFSKQKKDKQERVNVVP